MLMQSRLSAVTVTGGGGGISAAAAYSAAIDCSKSAAVKVRIDYTKVGIDLTLALVDASTSSSATISGTYDRVLCRDQSTAAEALTVSVAATGRKTITANLGGLVGLLRLQITGSGAGVVGDTLTYEITTVEEA